MDPAHFYIYEKLQPEQLRLCRFIRNGANLSAVLETFSADESPPYCALSYTWSSDHPGANDSWPLHIGEKRLPVLGSLKAFVQALRATGVLLNGTWWWIDSICINQADMQERSQQVEHMRQIYSDAHKVIVWLGPPSDDSDHALDFIHFLNGVDAARLNRETLRGILLQKKHRESWTALKHFFLRRWWSRIWTIQEFVIPSDVSFWCGPRKLARDSVFTALIMADRCGAPDFTDSPAFIHAWHRRRAWLLYKPICEPGHTSGLSLAALAAYFANNEATDDRDRLYGLYGLGTENHGLEISYALTVDEVYLRFAQSFITRHKSLDIIGFASLFVASPGSSLPSWAPDWRTKVKPFVVPLMTSQTATQYLGNLRPSTLFGDGVEPLSYSATGSRTAECSFEGYALRVQGYMIDVIDGLAGTRNSDLIQSSAEHSFESGRALSSTEILTSICRCLVLDRHDRYMRRAMPTKQFYHDFMELCILGLMPVAKGWVEPRFNEWFRFTRDLRFQGRSLADHVHNCDDGGIYPTAVQDDYIQDSFYGRFFDCVERMSLRVMTSRNGRIGMVPEKAMKGDSICLLLGCSVPLVLRVSGPKGQFTVVGECFLDGCMYGEALGPEDAPIETFHIV
ncbi:HET-domain-containing protein [Bimuria novae-zelandiae CBS 107.79]|uniref:HET-domain-containing protein n=1 Tax=Bimuria novae-zelandiae CBS 107.79 TaxID=1447943 RepID=A0A6A5V1J1_9PLEO|nr:HET-domain-containing protein [Bimuria novae-zelandiae CBS 107.79]